MPGILAAGPPVMGGSMWGTPPFLPTFAGLAPSPFVGGSAPAAPVFGGTPPPSVMGGGTPAFGAVMGQVMPQFRA